MFGAIDVGGTKTLVAVFNEQGKLLEKIRFETPKNYLDFKAELANTVEKLSTSSFTATTIALPGKVDRNRGVAIAFGNLDWENIPIRNDVEKILKCPVFIENDAKLAGLYESVLLPDKFHKVLYITISTGIGGGFITDRKINPYLENSEIGLMLLEHEGKLQRWQDFASGKAIKAKYGLKASDITDPKIWEQISSDLAVGLIDAIASLTPDIIVFGGGVGAHFDKFSKYLYKDLNKYKNALISIPSMVMAKNPEDAVIYGCYYLTKDKHENANS